MKGIPLDQYLQLQNTAATLTDEELEEQLFNPSPSRATKVAPQPTPAITSKEPDPDPESPVMATLQRIQRQADREDAIDIAVKAASHGVKVLAPLLIAVSKWISPEDEPEKLDRIMGSVLSRVRTDAAIVLEAYGLQKNEAPAWLTAQVSGQIMEVLVAAVDRNNGALLETNDQRYLAPLITLAHEAGGIMVSQYGQVGSRAQLAGALAMATTDVMTEYYSFNYFYPDPEGIAALISEELNERVIDGALTEITEQFDLSDDEVTYYGNSLLKQAGNIMSRAWSRGQENTEEIVRSMSRSTRELVMTEGYPLDAIFDDFEASFQGIKISTESALRALMPHRETMRPSEQSYDQALR